MLFKASPEPSPQEVRNLAVMADADRVTCADGLPWSRAGSQDEKAADRLFSLSLCVAGPGACLAVALAEPAAMSLHLSHRLTLWQIRPG